MLGGLLSFLTKKVVQRVVTFVSVILLVSLLVDYSIVVTGTTPYDYLCSEAQTQPSAYDEYLVRIGELGLRQVQVIRVSGNYVLHISTEYEELKNILQDIAYQRGVPLRQLDTLLYYVNRSISYNRIPIVVYKEIKWGTQVDKQLTILDAAPRAVNNYVLIRGEEDHVDDLIATMDLPLGSAIIINSESNILASKMLDFMVPWYMRIANYLYNTLTLNFGVSSLYRQPVMSVIATYLPYTLGLVGLAFIIGMSLGFISSFALSRKHGTFAEASIFYLMVAIRAMPVFWLGMIAVYFLAYKWGYFPSGLVTGFTQPTNIFAYISSWFWSTIIPALVLSKIYVVNYLLTLKSMLLDEMKQDYISLLRAIGFSDHVITEKYVVRNIAPPIVTLMSIDLGFIIGGAVTTETVFGYPGLGSLTYRAILSRDTPLIIGVFTITCIVVLSSITVAELLYSWLDPRIRG